MIHTGVHVMTDTGVDMHSVVTHPPGLLDAGEVHVLQTLTALVLGLEGGVAVALKCILC